MRVLMVTRETGPDRRYGLGRSLLPVVECLRERGIDVGYFCQDDLDPGQLQWREDWWRRLCGWPGLRLRPDRQALGRAWLERLQVGVAAARLARSQRYTHVHAHDPWLALGISFGLLGASRGIRWGLTQHGFGCYSVATHEDGLFQGPLTQRVLRRVEASVLARAAWVVAPTQACLTQLARDLCLRDVPAHWHHIPHGRPAVPPVSEASRRQSRAALGWTAGEFVVVAVGRLAPIKRFERLIESCARLAVPGLRLVIVGGGDAAGLRARADALEFGRQTHFALVEDVTPYLHGADLYVSPSSSESFGLANLEALCAGIPAVCSPVGGVPEVVADGAWLVPGEVDALTHAIGTLMRHEALRDEWAQRALHRAASWPTLQEVTQRYVDLYQAARP